MNLGLKNYITKIHNVSTNGKMFAITGNLFGFLYVFFTFAPEKAIVIGSSLYVAHKINLMYMKTNNITNRNWSVYMKEFGLGFATSPLLPISLPSYGSHLVYHTLSEMNYDNKHKYAISSYGTVGLITSPMLIFSYYLYGSFDMLSLLYSLVPITNVLYLNNKLKTIENNYNGHNNYIDEV